MATKHSDIERRKYERIKTNLIFSYQVVKPLSLCTIIGWGRKVKALMFDVSEGGVSFLTDYNIPKWAILFIKFILASSDVSDKEKLIVVETIGEVRYGFLAKKRKGKYRLGVSFVHINDGDKRIIADFVKKSKKRAYFTIRGDDKHGIIYWKNGVFHKKLPKANRTQ